MLGQCPRQGVLVDHELVTVPGTFLAGLHVDDEGVMPVEYQPVAWWRTGLQLALGSGWMLNLLEPLGSWLLIRRST